MSNTIPYMDGVSPSDLGLPPHFTAFRPDQIRMVDRTLNSTKRFIAHAAPTGSGKSGAVVAIAKYMGVRASVLTSTKGLQEQYLRDYHPSGMRDVRGRSNFSCISHPNETCEEGAHRKCRHTTGQQSTASLCPYKSQWAAAMESSLICTNYAYWCTIQRFSGGLGPFGLLILDEAHDAPDEISNQMTVTFSERELSMLDTSWPGVVQSLPQWKSWAKEHLPVAVSRYQTLYRNSAMADTRTIKEIAMWSSLASKLTSLSEMKGAWVVEPRVFRGSADGYKLQAVWPYTYAESVLFHGIEKVILVSATLSHQTLRLLGIKASDVDFYEYDTSFPASRCPVYSIPTVAMNHKSGDDSFSLLMERVDEIISGRLDRKGVIHGVSYSRAKEIVAASSYRQHMIIHSSGETQDAVEVFMSSPPPTILVSPSVTTGYDFAGDKCEYQIICKAPYPDLRSAVQRTRMAADFLYPAYEMVVALIQACGRGMRSEVDRCETFLIDDTITKVYDRHKGLWAKWFRPLVRKVDEVPSPPPTLEEEGSIPPAHPAD
jgi:Rad3-related DNA helicase